MSIGVPIKLLHEAEGHIVTIELKTGEVYRGQLYVVSLCSFLIMLCYLVIYVYYMGGHFVEYAILLLRI